MGWPWGKTEEEVGLLEKSSCIPGHGRCEVVTVTSAASRVLGLAPVGVMGRCGPESADSGTGQRFAGP